MKYETVDHISAWRADSHSYRDFTITLGEKQLDVIDRAVRGSCRSGIDVEQITADNFDLSFIRDDLEQWINQVMNCSGLLILSGLPTDRYTAEQMGMIHWGIGSCFGMAMSQSVMGDRLGHVVDVSGKDQNERAYRNSTGLAMHTDSCDVVGMMCLRQAASGGLSGYVSGIACYNEFLRRRPDLMPLLVEGFHYHRFGEELPGESPVTEERIPVFSSCDGLWSVNYLRSYIDLAAQEAGVSLSTNQLEALDLFDEIVHDSQLAMSFMVKPGELVFFNNRTILHNRTAFDDSPVESEKRHFLRLWLVAHRPRPTIDALSTYEGDGIKKQEGKSTYFEGRLKYREFGESSAE